MTLTSAWLVFASILLNASASVLLKFASRTWGGPLPESISWKFVLLNGSVMICYFAAFVAYGLALRHLPVSKAYIMITVGTQAILLVAGVCFLGERYNVLAWVGLAFVVAGVSLISMGTLQGTR